MNLIKNLYIACFIASAGVTLHAHAESFASSASSAGSASSGSISDSLSDSSNSSKDGDKVANGDYRVVDIARTPERAAFMRVTMRTEDLTQRVVLDLPVEVLNKQAIKEGDFIHAQRRAYGFEFSRADTKEAFYLVLADNWHDELAARRVVGM